MVIIFSAILMAKILTSGWIVVEVMVGMITS